MTILVVLELGNLVACSYEWSTEMGTRLGKRKRWLGVDSYGVSRRMVQWKKSERRKKVRRKRKRSEKRKKGDGLPTYFQLCVCEMES
jgi:hypothetical protein